MYNNRQHHIRPQQPREKWRKRRGWQPEPETRTIAQIAQLEPTNQPNRIGGILKTLARIERLKEIGLNMD